MRNIDKELEDLKAEEQEAIKQNEADEKAVKASRKKKKELAVKRAALEAEKAVFDKAKEHDAFVEILSKVNIQGENAIEFINKRIDEKKKKESKSSGLESKTDATKDDSNSSSASETTTKEAVKEQASNKGSEVKKDESTSAFSYDADKGSDKKAEVNSKPSKKINAFGGIAVG